MKNKILLSLIILLSISCSNKTNTFKSIQFMSYYYSRYDQKTREICEIHIKCNLYVEINEEGKAFVYRKQYYPIESTLFGEYKLNKSFIDSLLMAAKSYIEPKRDTIARIYDGPSLKFTFNYPDCSSNSIGFIDVEKAEYLPFLRLYHYLDSTLIKENLREPQFDTVNFKEQIVDFIDYTMHMDTLEYPFPPMPPKEQLKVVKYVLPDSTE